MSRDTIPFATNDISALAKSLRGQLAAREGSPSHVEMLNMLARATGHRNFQHLRAETGARKQLAEAAPPAPSEPEPASAELVLRAARNFDVEGRLMRWPSKRSQQVLALWAIWSRLPAGAVLGERAFNEALNAWQLFGDHALVRRELCDAGLVWRERDGSAYRRVERAPPAEAAALIRRLKPAAA